MGLCSLLDNALAEENIPLFVHFFTKGHPALQITAIQIITDILNQYGAKLLDNHPEVIQKVFIKGLKSGSKSPEVQSCATIAISKLLLGRIISDSSPSIDDLLRTLIILYFDNSTSQNQGVRQTLSYFLPVYSFSRRENQDRVRKVSVEVLRRLFEVQETEDEDAEHEVESVSLSTVGAHLVDWTDPRRCYVPGNQMTVDGEVKKNVNGAVHLEFARDLLERMYAGGCNRKYSYLLVSRSHVHSDLFGKGWHNYVVWHVLTFMTNRTREEIPSTTPCKTTHLTGLNTFPPTRTIRRNLRSD
jgi:condensin complex subunit 3